MMRISRKLLVPVANFRPKKPWDGPWGIQISQKKDRPFIAMWILFPLLLVDHLTREYYAYWHSSKVPVTDVFGDF
uniref:ATPEG7 n=1 Tax=Euglena gracilis TaxID=3039 RepID=UPI0012B67DD9|nr:Chain S, ATPEG7 [Euglena gracilis]6TDU_s Chain s, ATPEG7 [Euglena gracilis]6TDV_S Chain S, ATPEG7 [Euglena gracilis]6TDV_s Chain s, ATPEG7 [Euglena gracilis]